MTVTADPAVVDRSGAPALPRPRGPVSTVVLDALGTGRAPDTVAEPDDPYGEDAQLALYCLYELHYRGFDGVDPDREWDPDLLSLRNRLEGAFEGALRRDVVPGDDVATEIDSLLREPPEREGRGGSHHLLRDGEAWQLREYVVHRSLYHLKEADPQSWAIPRLPVAAKAAFVTVQHDEYGSGDPRRVHAEMFARMMRVLGVDDRYGAHLDVVPAPTLAEVNLMSLCGLHRRLRGALVGQFATVELTSSPGSDRLVRAIRRMGLPDAAAEFYDEHVEADAVHEQLVRHGVLTPLLADEPELAADVVFGIRASTILGARTEELMLERWAAGRSSLLEETP